MSPDKRNVTLFHLPRHECLPEHPAGLRRPADEKNSGGVPVQPMDEAVIEFISERREFRVPRD